jgi:hypothetical protein
VLGVGERALITEHTCSLCGRVTLRTPRAEDRQAGRQAAFCVRSACVLRAFCVRSAYVLLAFCLRSAFVLLSFCFRSAFVLLAFCFCFRSAFVLLALGLRSACFPDY